MEMFCGAPVMNFKENLKEMTGRTGQFCMTANKEFVKEPGEHSDCIADAAHGRAARVACTGRINKCKTNLRWH